MGNGTNFTLPTRLFSLPGLGFTIPRSHRPLCALLSGLRVQVTQITPPECLPLEKFCTGVEVTELARCMPSVCLIVKIRQPGICTKGSHVLVIKGMSPVFTLIEVVVRSYRRPISSSGQYTPSVAEPDGV